MSIRIGQGLPTDISNPLVDQILKYDDTLKAWVNREDTGGGTGGIAKVQDDSAPILGGDLNTNDQVILFTDSLKNDHGYIGTDSNGGIIQKSTSGFTIDSPTVRLANSADKEGSFLTVGEGGYITFTTLDNIEKEWIDELENDMIINTTAPTVMSTVNITEDIDSGYVEYHIDLELPYWREVTVEAFLNGALFDSDTYTGNGSYTFAGSYPIKNGLKAGDVLESRISSTVADYTVKAGTYTKVVRTGIRSTLIDRLKALPTIDRPIPDGIGSIYFDKDLGKPIIFDGTCWVDLIGNKI